MSRFSLRQVTLAIAVLALSYTNAQAGLVGLYKFDDASKIGLDSSGNGNDLVAKGSGAVYTSAGNSGGGLSLDGSSYLTTSDGSVPNGFPDGDAAYTLSVDFQTTQAGDNGLIGWGAYGNSNQVNALRLMGEGFRAYWWGNDLDASATVSDNTWHNVLTSFDGTTRSLWFDGTLIASDTPTGHNATGDNFAIGLTNFYEFFTGTLDNVAVYNTAVTPTQLSEINGSPNAVPEPSTIISSALGLVGGVIALARKRKAIAA